MEKTIVIDNKEIKFKATAATPMVYRRTFGRDIYIDATELYKSMATGEQFSVDSLNALEDIAYCMNSQAEGREMKRETIEKDMENWLEQFETFSIYKVLPQLMELWSLNTKQTAKPKK